MTPNLSGPEIEFVKRLLLKVLVFVLVAGAATVIHLVVYFLGKWDFPPIIILALTFLEYATLLADIVWFLGYLLQEIDAVLQVVLHRSTLLRILAITLALLVGAVAGPDVRKFFAGIPYPQRSTATSPKADTPSSKLGY